MKILVIKSSILDEEIKGFRGLRLGVHSPFLTKFGEWVEREPAEKDPTYRQVIPYVVVTMDGDVVLMRRKPKQTEERLYGKLYIGAGGHTEEGHSIFYTALKEVTEELGVPLSHLQETGLIVSTGSEVDSVHVGVLYRGTTCYGTFDSPEWDLHDPKWINAIVLKNKWHQPVFEKWSQLVIEHDSFLSIFG